MNNKIHTIIILILLLSCQNMFEKDIEKILGIPQAEYKINYKFNEFAGMNEDFTLEIYNISKKSITDFIEHSNKILPNMNFYNQNHKWHKFNWAKTPIVNDLLSNDICSMVLTEWDGKSILNNKLSFVSKLLKAEDNYYAFYYKTENTVIVAVKFFIISVRGEKIYVINSKIY